MRWPRAGVFTGMPRELRCGLFFPFGLMAWWSRSAWYIAANHREIAIGLGRFAVSVGRGIGWGWRFERGRG